MEFNSALLHCLIPPPIVQHQFHVALDLGLHPSHRRFTLGIFAEGEVC